MSDEGMELYASSGGQRALKPACCDYTGKLHHPSPVFATRELDGNSLLSDPDKLTAMTKMSDKKAIIVEDGGVIDAPKGEATEVTLRLGVR